MPLTTVELLPLIREKLAYNPQTGVFRWKHAHLGKPAGRPAGTITKDGLRVISLQARKYQAARLAWLFMTGELPEGHLTPRDGDPLNCAFDNLVAVPLSRTKVAAYQRARRDKLRDSGLQALRDYGSTVPGVKWDATSEMWLCTERVVRHGVITDVTHQKFYRKSDAERWQREFTHALEYIDAHPVPMPTEADENNYSGPHINTALSLAEARAWYCYDAERGAIYHREGRLHGHRADRLNTNGSPIVLATSRRYSAAMLAWFMVTGHWPARKAITFKDKDRRNFRFSNLELQE